jgi:hypothetical protein
MCAGAALSTNFVPGTFATAIHSTCAKVFGLKSHRVTLNGKKSPWMYDVTRVASQDNLSEEQVFINKQLFERYPKLTAFDFKWPGPSADSPLEPTIAASDATHAAVAVTLAESPASAGGAGTGPLPTSDRLLSQLQQQVDQMGTVVPERAVMNLFVGNSTFLVALRAQIRTELAMEAAAATHAGNTPRHMQVGPTTAAGIASGGGSSRVNDSGGSRSLMTHETPITSFDPFASPEKGSSRSDDKSGRAMPPSKRKLALSCADLEKSVSERTARVQTLPGKGDLVAGQYILVAAELKRQEFFYLAKVKSFDKAFEGTSNVPVKEDSWVGVQWYEVQHNSGKGDPMPARGLQVSQPFTKTGDSATYKASKGEKIERRAILCSESFTVNEYKNFVRVPKVEWKWLQPLAEAQGITLGES